MCQKRKKLKNLERKLEKLKNLERKLEKLKNLERKLEKLKNLERKLEKLKNLERKLEKLKNLERKLEKLKNPERNKFLKPQLNQKIAMVIQLLKFLIVGLSTRTVNKSKYQNKYKLSIKENEKFWAKEGKRISWIKKYTKIKDVKYSKEEVKIKWYYDGTLKRFSKLY